VRRSGAGFWRARGPRAAAMAGVGSGQAGAGSGETRPWMPGRLGLSESEVKKFGRSFELLLWSRGPWPTQTNAKLWRGRWGKYHAPGALFYPGSNTGRRCQGFGIKDSPRCHHFCDELSAFRSGLHPSSALLGLTDYSEFDNCPAQLCSLLLPLSLIAPSLRSGLPKWCSRIG
jgi:hypothetical protein